MTDRLNKYLSETAVASSEDEADIDDNDTCAAHELSAKFRFHYPQDEASLSLKRDYVLGLCADKGFTCIAAGLSNTSVKIYDLNASGLLTAVHQDRVPSVESLDTEVTICGVRFLDDSANTLLVGTTNGLVRLLDLRIKGIQAQFEYKSDAQEGLPPVPKTISCFDRNANSRIICCGTEQHMGNAYMVFFDVRERRQLGIYEDSHDDDVTSVLFHTSNPDLLCSGSTDGLINVFNIQESEEEEALLNTINTESSVHRLNWHRNEKGQDLISCITHTNDYMSYECQEGDEILSFNRSKITAGILRQNAGNFNLINAHNLSDGSVFLLAGTNHNRGEVLRSVVVPARKTLEPLTNFVGNKQIVRDSLYDANQNLLVTGGESGIITVWSSDNSNTKSSSNLKSKSKAAKSHKKNPY
ncbi:WD repeat-containing protein 89 [Drosophila nasuta]|uniref:WD repeat-containing protein 89 n=1 Tax=Drosophila nasuta TaxID=42062 RepID=UPI00295ED09E|nr:WD repeat-containing protein 89 [Drosophila nasuta]